jgi:hypothetical protein
MRATITIGIGVLLFSSTALPAQEIVFRASKPAVQPVASSAVTLGRPDAPSPSPIQAASYEPAPRIARGQGPPPPPAFPGGGAPAPVFGPIGGADAYNSGVVNNDADLGGFWTRVGDKARRCWDDVTGSASGVFQPGPNRSMFQSDREFDRFVSPMTNPIYFEDPRALTEIRPFFIWQSTPDSNPVFAGGNNFVVAARGSVAFTPYISFVVSQFGWSFINAENGVPPDVEQGQNNGFRAIHMGPKFTFIRNSTSNTVAAIGLNFELGTGSARVMQDTGTLSLAPYFSIAQNFGRNTYGSFNFINTDGYVFRTDSERSESFFASFHLDFDVGDAHRIYPLVELNYRYYTRNGNARDFNFEGNDLGNFGSRNVSGLSELTLAVGSRFVYSTNVQFGIAAEFNVLSNSSGRHLDQFRLTTDVIFRY